MRYPTMNEVEQAAGLLGMDVFDLALALSEFAQARFVGAADSCRNYEMPNVGRGRRAMAAAIACDQAWRSVIDAAQESNEA